MDFREILYNVEEFMNSGLYDELDPKVKKEFNIRLFRLEAYMDWLRTNANNKKARMRRTIYQKGGKE